MEKFSLTAACFAVFLLVLQCAGAAGELVIVREGTAEGIIVQTGDSPPERLAAAELQNYIEKISGARLKISEYEHGVNQRPAIIIGTLENSRETAPSRVMEKLSREERDRRSFYIKSEGNRLHVTGTNPIGALYGAYTLLEDYMGVRWFYPGELGEYVPERRSISFGFTDDFQEPSLNASLHLAVASYELGDTLEWMVRNKMKIYGSQGFRIFEDRNEQRGIEFLKQRDAFTSAGGHHLFRRAVPAEDYFEKNPEYFAMIGGGRTAEGRVQRCVSNPEVRKLVEEMVASITESENTVFRFSAEDAVGTWCQCDDCREMGTADGEFSVTNIVHRFFSKVAAGVVERNPRARMHFEIYTEYRTPPRAEDVSYGPNAVGRYCSHGRCYVHAFNDPGCPANRRQYGEFRKWQEIAPKVMLRDYIYSSNNAYAPFEYVLADDLRHLAEIGAYGWTTAVVPLNSGILERFLKTAPDSAKMWKGGWQTQYAAAKIGWDASLCVDELFDEAYDKYYGRAAPPMKEYHALRRRLWEAAPGHAFYGGAKREGYCLTVPGAESELLGLLDRAEEAAAGDETLLARISVDREFLAKHWQAGAEELRGLLSADKTIVPLKARENVKIDGELAEESWLSARPVENFISLVSGGAPVESTSVRVLYDDENLYFGIVAMAEHTWGELKADAVERDGPVSRDDSIEIQLAPPESEEDGIYYHIMSNTEGVINDARHTGPHRDISYYSGAEVSVRKLPDRQVYELRVPLEPMGAEISPGRSWGMHFVRNCSSLQPPMTRESSTVDGTRPHQALNFRRAVFGANALRNGSFSALEPASPGARGPVGERFLKHWGVNASEAEVIEGEKNVLRLRGGVVYQFLSIPAEYRGGHKALSGEVIAHGKGEINIRASTCIMPSGSGAFSHDRRTDLGTFRLGESPSSFSFELELEPDEYGYLYISSPSEDAFIRNVSAVLLGKN